MLHAIPRILRLLIVAGLAGCGGVAEPPRPPRADADPGQAAVVRATELAKGFGGYVSSVEYPELTKQPLVFQFRDGGPNDEQLAKLRQALEAVPRGVGINLNQCENVTDASIATLKDMHSLKLLSIGETKVTAKCLETVKTLKDLVYLYMDCREVGDADLAQLRGLAKMRLLSIYSPKLTEAGLAELGELTEMRKFHWSKPLGDVGLEHMEKWTNLEELELEGRGMGGEGLTNKGLTVVKGFRQLRKMHVGAAQFDDAGLADLATLPKLEYLTLCQCPQVTAPGLAKLRGIESLKRLELSYLRVSEAELANLKKALPACEVRWLAP